jgi:hypothetical protein
MQNYKLTTLSMLLLRAIYHQFFFFSVVLLLLCLEHCNCLQVLVFICFSACLPSSFLSLSLCLVLVFNVLLLMIINRLLLMLALNLSLNSFPSLSAVLSLARSLLSRMAYLKIHTQCAPFTSLYTHFREAAIFAPLFLI